MCYIALEGIDGCGKSTIHKLLQKEFKDAVFIREPGTTPFAETIRNAVFSNFNDLKPMTIQLAMLAARSDIKIDKEKLTISDRCFISGCYCEELQTSHLINDWLDFSFKYINKPDCIIYFDILATTSAQRLSNRTDNNGYDTLQIEEINKRINAYNRWINFTKYKYPEIKIIKIDANKGIQEVLNNVIHIIEGLKL